MKKIFDKIGWTGLIIIILFIIIYTHVLIRQNNRIKNPVYTKGTSLGISEGVSGHLYLYYSFKINNRRYNGSVTDDFCKACSECCDSGNAVIVRFQKDDPENNDLVLKLPNREILESK